jgi:hypothetical protein
MSRDLNITRPTTKLHAPPGGKSSFSIGGDYEPVKAKTVTAPVVAAPAPVPAAVSENVPVSAPAPVQRGSHMQSEAPVQRAAVRVRQAPGGTSSIVIG